MEKTIMLLLSSHTIATVFDNNVGNTTTSAAILSTSGSEMSAVAMWPLLIPTLLLLLLIALRKKNALGANVGASLSIVAIAVEALMAWRYFTMPISSPGSWQSYSWPIITICVLLQMIIILWCAVIHTCAIVKQYHTEIRTESILISFGIGALTSIVGYVIITMIFGFDSSDAITKVVNGAMLLVGALGSMSYMLIRQNRTIAKSIPMLVILWTLTSVMSSPITFVAACILLGYCIYRFFYSSGRTGNAVYCELLGDDCDALCTECKLFEAAHCAHTHRATTTPLEQHI